MRVLGDWLLTPERAAIHVPTATAVVADLHLGYSEVRCRGGEALPTFGLDDTVALLGSLVARHRVRRLLIAGDLFEDSRCHTAAAELLEWLKGAEVELAGVIPGNHDRGLAHTPGSLPVYPEGIELGGWRVLHGDGPIPGGRVVHGHVHPCLRWGTRIAAPCYLVGARRLILPAFSADAAGVNVLGDRRWGLFRCGVASAGRVLDFGTVSTLPNRLAATR